MPSITVKFTVTGDMRVPEFARKYLPADDDGLSYEIIEVEGVQWKTPQRTLFWSRLCSFVAKQIEPGQQFNKDDVIDYCISMRGKAENEGYEDTAQYLQHIINDLSK